MSDTDQLLELTADVVAAYVSHNPLARPDIPGLVATVATALAQVGEPAPDVPEVLTPPVSIKKSITPDYLISMEDGKRYKSLKRHVGTYGLTPDEYRAKWGLPRDYPMVAASYSATRSSLAKTMGLGRKKSAPAKKSRGKAKA